MAGWWDTVTLGFFVTAAISGLVFAAWLYPRRGRMGPAGTPMIAALVLTSMWALGAPSLGMSVSSINLLLSLSNLAWIWTLYRLFANDKRHTTVKPVRPVVLSLGLVQLLLIALSIGSPQLAPQQGGQALFSLGVTLQLLFAVGALVLVHNLYVGATAAARSSLRWPATAMGAIWLYDLNFYTIAYLTGAVPETLAGLRGVMLVGMVALLAIGQTQSSTGLIFRPSRPVTFQSASLLLIGGYMIGMVLVAQAMSYAGSDFARLLQLFCIVVATSLALLTVPSRRLRGWMRVTLAKHLFQHRYDYRAEWLRFTETMGGGGELGLHERAVQALADITDSQRGLLLTPNEHGAFSLEARWQWPHLDVPGEALPANLRQLFGEGQYVVDLDRVRADADERLKAHDLPEWLITDSQAWALVPLVLRRRLVGVILLSRPAIKRRLDWEDFDLLRVAAQQLASYLAEHASQEALSEAQRFDEFNRRIAFVIHDIKNLASQMSLLARNAERHADKAEFRADMLVTLRNSAEKLNALLARLGRYGANVGEKATEFRLDEMVGEIVARFSGQHSVQLVQRHECRVRVNRDALEQAVVHLVQNAVDASDSETSVFVNVTSSGLQAEIEIVDSGCGMSADFIRNQLFKPFRSTKSGGFGIGAFEARELVRALGGRMELQSREGLGTRFQIRLPIAAAVDIYDKLGPQDAPGEQKVA